MIDNVPSAASPGAALVAPSVPEAVPAAPAVREQRVPSSRRGAPIPGTASTWGSAVVAASSRSGPYRDNSRNDGPDQPAGRTASGNSRYRRSGIVAAGSGRDSGGRDSRNRGPDDAAGRGCSRHAEPFDRLLVAEPEHIVGGFAVSGPEVEGVGIQQMKRQQPSADHIPRSLPRPFGQADEFCGSWPEKAAVDAGLNGIKTYGLSELDAIENAGHLQNRWNFELAQQRGGMPGDISALSHKPGDVGKHLDDFRRRASDDNDSPFGSLAQQRSVFDQVSQPRDSSGVHGKAAGDKGYTMGPGFRFRSPHQSQGTGLEDPDLPAFIQRPFHILGASEMLLEAGAQLSQGLQVLALQTGASPFGGVQRPVRHTSAFPENDHFFFLGDLRLDRKIRPFAGYDKQVRCH